MQVVVAELGEGTLPTERWGACRHGPGHAAERIQIRPAALVPPVALELLWRHVGRGACHRPVLPSMLLEGLCEAEIRESCPECPVGAIF